MIRALASSLDLNTTLWMHMQSPWETNAKTSHQQDLTKPWLTSKQGLNVSHILHTDFFPPVVTDEKSTFADGGSPNTITRGQRKQQILCCRGYCYLDRIYSRKEWRVLPYKSLTFFCKHEYQLHFFSSTKVNCWKNYLW